MLTTITVTQEHIHNGKRGRSLHCPVSLALREASPKAFPYPTVDSVWISFHNLSPEHYPLSARHVTRLPCPLKASNFINRFDAAKSVKPFTFKLEIPA